MKDLSMHNPTNFPINILTALHWADDVGDLIYTWPEKRLLFEFQI